MNFDDAVGKTKAQLTIRLEKRLLDVAMKEGLGCGLSVHQVTGALAIVQHQVMTMWEQRQVGLDTGEVG